MKKSEYIVKYGEAAWEKMLAQSRAWRKAHREEEKARAKRYREEHPEEVKANSQEADRKGGRRYDKKMEYKQTGLQGKRHRIRAKHGKQYKPYKQIIAPDSQIHHEWIPKTADYIGVALVEANPHRYGIIDVIQILDGKITLLTEKEIKKKGEKAMDKEKKVEGKVTSWGIRLQVPAPVIKGIKLAVDDEVEWGIEEREGKMVAILSKREIEE